MKISKALVQNQRSLLSDAVNSGYITDFDLDNNTVFIERWTEDHYATFRHTFTMTETTATISEDSVEVIRTVDFKEVALDADKSLDKAADTPLTESFLMKVLNKHFGGSKKDDIQVIKQFGSEDEPMYCVEPLYIAPGEVDGTGDTMDLEAITGMVESLNKANEEGRLQSGYFHKHKTDTWSLDKAWINPVTCMIGDQLVPEGQPIAKTLFTSKAAFAMRVNGDISGLSIGARAKSIVDLTKDLSTIQSTPVATRQLVGVHFDWDHPELTYTSPSQGGAASLKNEAYEISKAKKAVESDLDEEQASILKEIGESFVSLEKHLNETNTKTPSSVSTGGLTGDETKLTKGTNMSENMVTRKEFETLQKALAVSQAENSITGYAFDAEVNKAVAGAIAALDADGQAAVVKAFDALVARTDAEVTKAKEISSKAKPEVENELSKALETEAGNEGEVETPVEKSLAERALEAQATIQGVK